MIALVACIAMLASPDATLRCVMHNPDLAPITIGDTSTPGHIAPSPAASRKPIPPAPTCYTETLYQPDGTPYVHHWCVIR